MMDAWLPLSGEFFDGPNEVVLETNVPAEAAAAAERLVTAWLAHQ